MPQMWLSIEIGYRLKEFFLPEINCFGKRFQKTAVTAYMTYFPCRGEGHSVLAPITTFYLVLVQNILGELLSTVVFLVSL